MPWARFDDETYDHPKVERAGPAGFALWAAAILYSNRKLTDGHVPRSVVRRLLDFDALRWDDGGRVDPLDVANRLVDVGLFERNGTGYLVHDYLKYQPPAAEIRKRRAAEAERLREYRRRKRDQRDQGK